MDNINYNARMLHWVVEQRLLVGDPFTLFDVGCGLGIDPVWRFFGGDLHAHGFDPQEEECAKLSVQEQNRNVHYHPTFVGLPPSDPFHAGREAARSTRRSYFDPGAHFTRGSSYVANLRKQAQVAITPSSSLESTEQWSARRLATGKIALSHFIDEQRITNVDFVKIDTDGGDLEAAASCQSAIRRATILGFMIECCFTGSQDPTENSFHNVDAFMRRNGFVLYALTANRYSRAALPAPFLYPALYQTVSGQPIWGDMIYLRDGASNDYRTVWGDDLSATKLLKLACLYELFQLPDCAAELVLAHRDRLQQLVDPTVLLNLLTPRFRDRDRSYSEYLQLFEEHVDAFFPES
jgi:hypothetical protein